MAGAGMNYNSLKANIATICLKKPSVLNLPIGSKVKALQKTNRDQIGDIGEIIGFFEHSVAIYINRANMRVSKFTIDKWFEAI